jgi:hypothetical protein
MTPTKDDPWHIIPNFPLEDWIQEVTNLDTRLGYLDWVAHKATDAPYTLVVGNIGSFEYESMIEAYRNFDEYKQMSIENYGRAAGEPVTLFDRSGEICLEHTPT